MTNDREWWNGLAGFGKNWPGQLKKAVGIQSEPTDADLQRMLALEELKLEGNKILDDIRPLVALSLLKDLSLPYSVGINLNALKEMGSLIRLDLSNNYLRDATVFAGLSNLTFLNLQGNRLQDLTALAGLDKLQTLWIDSNQLEDLTPLAGVKALKGLNIRKNNVQSLKAMRDLEWLRPLKEISQLVIEETHVSDLSPLSGLNKLSFRDADPEAKTRALLSGRPTGKADRESRNA